MLDAGSLACPRDRIRRRTAAIWRAWSCPVPVGWWPPAMSVEPYRLSTPTVLVVEPVSVFLRELLASGRSAATLRSYGMDLLRWWRFLDAVDVGWDRATRAEARDFSCWIQLTVKQRRQTTAAACGDAGRSAVAGAPNPVTGQARAGDGYAPATVAHSETVLRRLLRLPPGRRHRPDPEPVPAGCVPPVAAGARAPQPDGGVDAASGWGGTGRRCRGGSRGRSPMSWFNELFAALASNRDRALVAFWISTGARAVGAAGGAAVRRRSGRAADQRGAQGLPRRAAGAGIGGRVRLAAAVSAGAARRGSPGPHAAGVVDAAPAAAAADLPRGAPDVRAGQRRRSARTGRCTTCGTARRPGWPATRS